jgi:hypothetical protein
MRTVDRVFETFQAAFAEGGVVDPVEFLTQVRRSERAELAMLIDAYLAIAPRQRETRSVGADEAEVIVEELAAGLVVEPWSSLLPRLRQAADLHRSVLASRLAAALALQGQEDRVLAYYDRMEADTLQVDGVSDRVLSALAGLLGTDLASLRASGASADPGEFGVAASAFARVAPVQQRGGSKDDCGSDEVDRLFSGRRTP